MQSNFKSSLCFEKFENVNLQLIVVFEEFVVSIVSNICFTQRMFYMNTEDMMVNGSV